MSIMKCDIERKARLDCGQWGEESPLWRGAIFRAGTRQLTLILYSPTFLELFSQYDMTRRHYRQ